MILMPTQQAEADDSAYGRNLTLQLKRFIVSIQNEIREAILF